MSTMNPSQKQSRFPPRQWAIKNKLRQFAKSGRQLLKGTGGALTAAAEEEPQAKCMTFSLYAPEAGCVSLAGDFNAWSPDDFPLEKSGDGLWERVITLAPGRYEYRFVVDGQWCNDPRCTAHVPNPYGGENCVVILS